MAEDPFKKNPVVKPVTTETVFSSFDSILIIDAGSDGFRLKDSAGAIVVIPTGIPVSISGPAGRQSGPITIMAPASGSLNASVIYYN